MTAEVNNITEGNNKIGELGENEFYREAFQRNIGILTQEEQEKLRNAKIAIAGMGGVGAIHLATLTRMGMGNFNIADADFYELPNIQRQFGAYTSNLGKNKAEVMEKIAREINPFLKLKVFPENISEKNIDKFLDKIDIFIDGIDAFNIDARRLIFKKAKNMGIWSITAGPLGFSSALLVFSPDGMSFDDYFGLSNHMSDEDKIISFLVGLAPAGLHMKYINPRSVDFKAKTGPSMVSACNLCSSLAATETLKIILNRGKIRTAPRYLQFDPYMIKLKKGWLVGGGKNPLQFIKRYYAKKILRGIGSI